MKSPELFTPCKLFVELKLNRKKEKNGFQREGGGGGSGADPEAVV